MGGTWRPNSFVGFAKYPFLATGPHQLGLKLGDKVQIFEEARGWYRGFIISQTDSKLVKKGIFPASYIQKSITTDSDVEGSAGLSSNVEKVEFAEMHNEINSVLREWNNVMQNFYTAKKFKQFNMVRDRMAALVQIRRDIMTYSEDREQVSKLKKGAIALMEQGRRDLGLDLIVRMDTGEPADEENVGIYKLFKMHQRADALEKMEAGISPAIPGAGRPMQHGRRASVLPSLEVFTNRSKSGDKDDFGTVQILLTFDCCVVPIGDDSELRFSLYNGANDKISEDFIVHLGKGGMPIDASLSVKTLFKDISQNESKDLYLVATLYRSGGILSEDEIAAAGPRHKNAKYIFKRPYGVSVVALSRDTLLDCLLEKELRMKVFQHPRLEQELHLMREHIIMNNNNIYIAPNSIGITIKLRAYRGSYDECADNRPYLLKIPYTGMMSFPEVILPSEKRNDFYVNLLKADVSSDKKITSLLCRMYIVDKFGTKMENLISVSSALVDQSVYETSLFLYNNTPHWDEIVKLRIPPNLINQLHIYLEFYSPDSTGLFEKMFAFSFSELTDEDGTVLKDGLTTLPLYKPIPQEKLDENPVFYLKKSLSNKNKKGNILIPRKDTVTLSTKLVSTRLTQNSNLLGLLKYRKGEKASQVADMLNAFSFIQPDELAKFMREIFDSLFSILLDRQDDLVVRFQIYDAIVRTISELAKSRFANFMPVLEEYINKTFNGPGLHLVLLQCLISYMQRVDDIEYLQKVNSSLKMMKYIFMFVKVALRQGLEKEEESSHDQMMHATRESVKTYFGLLNMLILRTSPNWILGSQMLALKHIPDAFEPLKDIVSWSLLSSSFNSFVSAAQPRTENKDTGKKIVIEKLNMWLNIVKGPLFIEPNCRKEILPNLLEILEKSLEKDDASYVDISLKIIGMSFNQVQMKIENSDSAIKEIDKMFGLLANRLKKNNSADQRAMIRTLIFAFIYILPGESLESVIIDLNPIPTAQYNFMQDVINICTNALSIRTYPSYWLALSMLQYRSILKFSTNMSTILLTRFTGATFSFNIWKDYFDLLVKFINVNALQLEKFSTVKRSKIMEKYGDLRADCGKLLSSTWYNLGETQFKFIPTFVGPFLELTRIHLRDIQLLGLNLYFSMLEREFKVTKAVKRVEQATVDTLDKIVNMGVADAQYRHLIVDSLEKLLRDKPEMGKVGAVFLSELKLLLDLMSALRVYPDTPLFEDERTSAMMKLMSYLKKTDRMDLFLKYVHMLGKVHVSTKSYTEAGMSLLLHSDLLNWSDEMLPEMKGNFPAQSAVDRKLALLIQASEFFNQGKAWERAIELAQIMRSMYESHYMYDKLSDLLKKEAEYFNNIHTIDRFFAEYFRVAYYGKGWPIDIRGQEFVYRGFELERLSEFVGRMQKKWPQAELMTSTEAPSDNIRSSHKQYLQIVSIQPSSRQEMLGGGPQNFEETMPERIKKYKRYDNVNVFTYSRPYHKNKVKGGNEFKTLWISESYLVTQEKFPSYIRRSHIVEVRKYERRPAENAVNAISTKNKDIRAMLKKYSNPNAKKLALNPFTMTLNGVIDAAVNGGVYNYSDAFFQTQFLEDNPEDVASVKEMQNELREQMELCAAGLEIHKKLCSQEMLPMQDKLITQFKSTMKPKMDELIFSFVVPS